MNVSWIHIVQDNGLWKMTIFYENCKSRTKKNQELGNLLIWANEHQQYE